MLLLPRLEKIMLELGENIKLARLRRELTIKQVSERSNLSEYMYKKVEAGDSKLPISIYVNVFFVLRMENEISNLALEDKLGRRIQDAKLLSKEV